MKITVRKVKESSGVRWCLDYTPQAGKRIRRFFRTRDEADRAADVQEIITRRAGESWLALSTVERADLIGGYDQIRKLGLTLHQVLEQWRTGLAAADAAAAKPLANRVSLEAAGNLWLTNLRTSNRRPKHLRNCSNWITRFAAGRTEMPVDAVKLKDVQDWLAPFENLTTWNSYRDVARAFFSFCLTHAIITVDPVSGQKLPAKHVDWVAPSTLTPDQISLMFRWVMAHDRDLLCYVTLATFAGIRPDECDRMTWDMIDLERGLIRLPAHASKVRRPRQIHLHPTALAWLKCARENNSPCGWNGSARLMRMRHLRAALGFATWPHDIMRHTYGSMAVELTHDLARTALEMGNSPAIILRNYRDIVRPDDCAKFWSLTPEVVCLDMQPV